MVTSNENIIKRKGKKNTCRSELDAGLTIRRVEGAPCVHYCGLAFFLKFWSAAHAYAAITGGLLVGGPMKFTAWCRLWGTSNSVAVGREKKTKKTDRHGGPDGPGLIRRHRPIVYSG